VWARAAVAAQRAATGVSVAGRETHAAWPRPPWSSDAGTTMTTTDSALTQGRARTGFDSVRGQRKIPRESMDDLVAKADALRRLHTAGPMLVLPNAWDAASARIFEQAGFPALATTSAGIAYAQGYADGERISRAEMLAVVTRIAATVAVPVTADMEAGYGRTPEAVTETVRGVIAAGAVGMNLEDSREEDGGALIDFPLAVERVRAARAAAVAAGVPIVVNARTDAFSANAGGFAEAVRRGTAYREAGADSIFVPFVGDRDTIEGLVRAIPAPVNILGGSNAPTLRELEALGVRRVTFGSAPMRATLGLVRRMAREWKDKGTYGTLEAYGIPFAELQRLFG
jgi:2-methylisocitrate lyase-like PEP mutase family enzyme